MSDLSDLENGYYGKKGEKYLKIWLNDAEIDSLAEVNISISLFNCISTYEGYFMPKSY